MVKHVTFGRGSTRRVQCIALFAIFATAAAGFFWYRYIQPSQMLSQARAIADADPRRAEQMVAEAIVYRGSDFPEAELLRAHLLSRIGQWDEAAGQFSLIKHPELLPAGDLAAFAMHAEARRRFFFAVDLFKAAKGDPEVRVAVLRSLIRLRLQLGQEDAAVKECQELLEDVPDDATAWQIIATVTMNQKKLAEAEQALTRCLQFSKVAEQIRNVREDLVQVLIDSGRVADARTVMELLKSESNPLTDRASIAEAWILRMEGRPQDGIDVMSTLLNRAVDPPSTKARFLRGLLYSDVGNTADGIKDLSAVAAAEPFNKEAHHKLAELYSRENQTAKAAPHREISKQLTETAIELLKLKNRLSTEPANRELRNEVADLYIKLGQPEQAKRLLGGRF